MFDSPEISELIPSGSHDVLRYSEDRHRYEVSPKRYSSRVLQNCGFNRDANVYFSYRAKQVRTLPEWELLADPDTYARLKTK